MPFSLASQSLLRWGWDLYGTGTSQSTDTVCPAATVEYGGQVGAQVLEGYPTEPVEGKTVIWDEASVGLLQVFLEAGYEVVASPTLRRRVVRIRLGGLPSAATATA